MANYDGAQIKAATVTEAKLSVSDNTTANVSTTKHGFCPKMSGSATTYLDGTGVFTTPAGGVSTVFGRSGTVVAVAGDYDATKISYTPATGANWVDPDPTTVAQALDRIAAVVSVGGATPIP